MFLLGRALSLGSKRLEAIKYYLDAAEDLAGMCVLRCRDGPGD